MSTKKPLWQSQPKGRQCLLLFNHLSSMGVEVQCERTFTWLFHPIAAELLPDEKRVLQSLRDHCSHTKGSHPVKACCDPDKLLGDDTVKGRRRRLEVDFFLPELNVAIEFDERQHFTAERAVTFPQYRETKCYFDVSCWQAMCSRKVIDADPPCRDWERAFRDSVRDIRAAQEGVILLRFCYKDDTDAMTRTLAPFFKDVPKTVVQ